MTRNIQIFYSVPHMPQFKLLLLLYTAVLLLLLRFPSGSDNISLAACIFFFGGLHTKHCLSQCEFWSAFRKCLYHSHHCFFFFYPSHQTKLSCCNSYPASGGKSLGEKNGEQSQPSNNRSSRLKVSLHGKIPVLEMDSKRKQIFYLEATG